MVNDINILRAPRNLECNNLTSLLRVFNVIFSFAGKEKERFHLSFTNVDKCDVTGVLTVYKLLEFCVLNKCFSMPTHDIVYNEYLKSYIDKFGFAELIKSLMNSPDSIDLRPYKKLKVSSDSECLIAPIALIREDNQHSIDIIKRLYEPKITAFYDNTRIRQMILSVFTEVMHNFWSHATSDNKSVIVGYGTKHMFNIACCDNGIGIDGSMSSIYPNVAPARLMSLAMTNGITSKIGTSHMGYGLWYINEVVKRINGSLMIISNSTLYRNDYGKVFISSCPTWKGCVISIKLPLSKPITISDIELVKKNDININFI